MPEILLVEDSADDIELTLRAFRRREAQQSVAVVKDGEEALEYLFREGRYEDRDVNSSPRLVLLDLNLPKLGGVQVLQRLRSDDRTKLLPVVVLTTSAEPRDLEECYGYGANSYVRKPVDFRDFESVVDQLHNYWLSLNLPPRKGA